MCKIMYHKLEELRGPRDLFQPVYAVDRTITYSFTDSKPTNFKYDWGLTATLDCKSNYLNSWNTQHKWQFDYQSVIVTHQQVTQKLVDMTCLLSFVSDIQVSLLV
jgi:hypothetical protein